MSFEIRTESEDVVRQKAIDAFESMRMKVAKSGMPEMSLDEINAEIKAVRDAIK